VQDRGPYPASRGYSNVPKPEREEYDKSVNRAFYRANPDLAPEPYMGRKSRRRSARRKGAR